MDDEILGFTRHPVSAVWPDLDGKEFTTLVNDVEERGLDHPILVTPDSQVVDGWHRLRACAELGITPTTTLCELTEESLARKVIGLHAGRRHLTKADLTRFTIAAMRACGMQFAEKGDNQFPSESSQEPQPAYRSDQNGPTSPTITREAVAEEANVSVRTATRHIQEAKRQEGLLPFEPPIEDGNDSDAPPKLPRRSKEEQLQDQIFVQEKEIKGYLQQIQDLTDELEHYKNVQAGYDAEAAGADDRGIAKSFKTVERLLEERRSLTVRVNEQMHLRKEAERENKRLRKWLKSLGQDIKV